MRFFGGRDRLLTAAERARREHSAWLSRALGGSKALPRIPSRRVSEGGFSAVLQTACGRQWAERWWLEALERVD